LSRVSQLLSSAKCKFNTIGKGAGLIFSKLTLRSISSTKKTCFFVFL